MDQPKKPTLDDIFAEIGFPDPPKPLFTERTKPSFQETSRYPVGVCGKISYPSEATAKQAIHNRLNKGTGGATRLIAYKCDKCGGGWHMTSRKPEDAIRRK
jgi:hypothetical protein